jgi:ribosomal protein L37AE/L43A
VRRLLLVAALVAVVVVPSALANGTNPADRNAAKHCKARDSKRVETGVLRADKCKRKHRGARKHNHAKASTATVSKCRKQKAKNEAAFTRKYKNLCGCIEARKSGTL